MIKPEQIRIGNILKLNNPEYRPRENGRDVKVIGITQSSATLRTVSDDPFSSEFGQLFEYLQGIEITPKRLKKYGFKQGTSTQSSYR